jgi:PAS domain S-box-containing protein
VNGEPQHPASDIGVAGSFDSGSADDGGIDGLSFEALFDHAPFGYLITDTDDVIVRANETFSAWTGFGADDLVGRHFRDLLPPGSQLLYETRHLPVLRLRGSVDEVFLEVRTAGGPVLPVLANAVVEDGEVRIGVLAAANRLSYEQQLLATQRTAESLAARITVLQDASSAFAAGGSEEAIAHSLSAILEETLVASDACVALVSRSGALDVIAGSNPLDGLIRGDYQLLGLNVVKFEEPVVVHATDDYLDSYPWVVRAMREARLQTVAVFPMMSDARPIGVTAAFFRRERTLAESETEVVLAVARQASQVLTRLRAQEQLAYAALHDQLTGLANRESIRHSIALALEARSPVLASERAVSVMFLDLDGFKTVNDRLGHHVGDATCCRSRRGCGTRCASETRWGGTAATSSSSSATRRARRPRRSPSASATRSARASSRPKDFRSARASASRSAAPSARRPPTPSSGRPTRRCTSRSGSAATAPRWSRSSRQGAGSRR